MLLFVDRAVRTEGARAGVNGSVPVSFLDIGFARSVYLFQRTSRVDRERVWRNADD